MSVTNLIRYVMYNVTHELWRHELHDTSTRLDSTAFSLYTHISVSNYIRYKLCDSWTMTSQTAWHKHPPRLHCIQPVAYRCHLLCKSPIICVTNCSIYVCTLQHTATYCSSLQHTAACCNMLQHTACNTLQQTAANCNNLRHTATHLWAQGNNLHGDMVHHTVSHYTTPQHTATHCNAPVRAR